MSEQERQSESGQFGRVAAAMVANGWSIFPQTRDRKPGSVMEGGKLRPIQWKEDYHLDERLPDPYTVDTWIKNCGDLNVACVFGTACNNAFALDIDITDKKIARRVEKIITRHLGPTPLRRIGRAPKVALFYRSLTPVRSVSIKLQKCYTEDAYEQLREEDKVFCRKRIASDGDNEIVLYDAYDEDGNTLTDDQMIEVAGTNKLMTIWGIHHKTGKPFNWMTFDEEIGDYRSPLNTKPTDLPVVTPDDVQEALDAVFSVYNQYYGKGMSGGLHVGQAQSVWTEDDEGKITDGRENWLWKNCIRLADEHYEEIKKAGENGFSQILDRLTDKMAGSLHDITDYGQFGQYCVIDGQWDKDTIRNQARSKLVRQMRRIVRGDVKRKKVIEDHKAVIAKAPQYSFSSAEEEFSWMTKEKRIVPFGDNDSRLNFQVLKSDRDDSLEIPEDRSHIKNDIAQGIQSSITSFFDRVYKKPMEDGYCVSFTEMLVAPTGSGKTSQFLQRIAEDPRTHLPYVMTGINKDGEEEETLSHPFLFLSPNYENINEQFKKVCVWGIDSSLNDSDMAQEASDRGYGTVEEALADIDFIRYQSTAVKLPAGVDRVRVMIWKGKEHGGCRLPENLKIAGQFGYGTQNFCKRKRSQKDIEKDPSSGEFEFCQYYDECPVIAQRERVRHVDLVFMPHAFMEISTDLLPEPLKKPRAVLVDERVYQYFLHTELLDIEVLETERAIPAMSRFEKDDFEDEEEYIDMIATRQRKRATAVDVLLDAFSYGDDVGKAFLSREDGRELIAETMTLVKANLRRDMRLKPNMDIEDVKMICDVDNGRGLREELKLWEIVHERMRWLENDHIKNHLLDDYKKELEAIDNMIAITEDGNEMLPSMVENRERLADKIERTKIGIRAKGAYDYRLQVVFPTDPEEIKKHKKEARGNTDNQENIYANEKEKSPEELIKPMIRMSWRTQPNWKDRPTILLDASAAPEIIRKIWGTNGLIKVEGICPDDWKIPTNNELVVRNIVSEKDIGKSLNMHVVAVMPWTNSASSFSGKYGAARLEKTRKLIDCVSLLHSDSRVVCGSNKSLRNRIRYNWHGLDNQDWCHFGAMRGLDMFRDHGAAVYVGRMELPVSIMDGLVAALTYDDDRPEPPLDIWGTGFRERMDGKTPLMMPKSTQVNYVRNGNRMSIDVPRMPSYYPVIRKDYVEDFDVIHGDELPYKWGQLIQRQYREEEIMQFVGRVRPVYRQGRPPVCYAFSTVIPENIIIDEVVHVDELINGEIPDPAKKGRYKASRRGVIADFIERYGVIGEHLINITGDFVSANPDRLLRLNGMDCLTGKLSGRLSRGFGVIKYEYNGDSHYAFVPAHRDYEDSCDMIRQLLMVYDVGSPDMPEFTREAWPLMTGNRAAIRGEDNVDREFGKNRYGKQSKGEMRIGKRMISADLKRMEKGKLTYHKLARRVENSEGKVAESLSFALAEMTLEDLDEAAL